MYLTLDQYVSDWRFVSSTWPYIFSFVNKLKNKIEKEEEKKKRKEKKAAALYMLHQWYSVQNLFSEYNPGRKTLFQTKSGKVLFLLV